MQDFSYTPQGPRPFKDLRNPEVRAVVTRCCAEPVAVILRGYPQMQAAYRVWGFGGSGLLRIYCRFIGCGDYLLRMGILMLGITYIGPLEGLQAEGFNPSYGYLLGPMNLPVAMYIGARP